MEIGNINELFNLCTREKERNNVLYLLKMKGFDIDDLCIRHSCCLHNIMKIISLTGFNDELDEPKDMEFDEKKEIKSFLDDLQYYSLLLKLKEPEINEITSELIHIKKGVLEKLIFENKEEEEKNPAPIEFRVNL